MLFASENDKVKVESSRTPKLLCKLNIAENQWNQFTDNQAAETHGLEGGSLLIEGLPGTGKSYFAKGIVERLIRLGKKVAIISKTHVASSRIGGLTADVWCRKYIMGGSPTCDVQWVDECSQLDILGSGLSSARCNSYTTNTIHLERRSQPNLAL